MKALGIDSAGLDALKFDPNQPRVPAGSGRESGRWTSGDGGSGASARIIPVSDQSRKSNVKESTLKAILRTIFMRKGAPSEPRRKKKTSSTAGGSTVDYARCSR